ncbi:Protein of unknown function [Cotesia congregata]|uniref:BEN domain-containing protein n=1 Tax=Cotesia congregata TaxID=51543 RepID=A0A8J2MPH7_COTCN|nr:Protein of unknown function [Cotesia congregata]
MENKIFALLRWVGGEYRDVPVEWIKDFNVESFDSENEDPDLSYVVEWRVKNKMPKKGWPCADAQVVAVSEDKSKLQQKLQSIEGSRSPLRCKPKKKNKQKNNLIGNVAKNKKETPAAMQTSNNDIIGKASGSGTSKSYQNKTKRTRLDTNSNRSGKILPLRRNLGVEERYDEEEKQDGDGNEEEKDGNLEEEEEKEKDDSGESDGSSSDEEIFDDFEVPVATDNNGGIGKLFKKVFKELKTIESKLDENQRNDNPRDPDDQVELGHAGSNVFIPLKCWTAANAQTSFTSMAISLVKSVFSTEERLRSNLRGKRSRINRDAPIRPALDELKMNAIEEAVKNKFDNYKKSYFGSAINNMLNDERRKNNAAANNLENAEEN